MATRTGSGRRWLARTAQVGSVAVLLVFGWVLFLETEQTATHHLFVCGQDTSAAVACFCRAESSDVAWLDWVPDMSDIPLADIHPPTLQECRERA